MWYIMKTSKIVSVILAAGLISAATVAVNAADTTGSVDLAVESVSANAGEQVLININANIPDTGVAGCEFAFKYDPSVLTIESVKEGNLSGNGASAEELAKNAELADTMISGSDYSCLDYSIHSDKGEVDIMWCTGLEDQKYWLKGEGQFITIVATVNDKATGDSDISVEAISRDGNSDIVFGYVDYSNNSEVTYTVNAKAGTLTVGGDVTTDEPIVTTPSDTTPSDTTTSGTAGSLGEATLLGDVSNDGIIDIRDVTTVNQYIIKAITLDDVQMANGDVIADGVVDVSDLGQIKKYILKLISKF